MTNSTRNSTNIEQIKNNTNISNDICRKFKIFLEKDNFGVVKSKSQKLLESKIIESVTKIEQLKDLQMRSEKAIARLDETLKKKQLENRKLKESLMLQMNHNILHGNR
jgi:hypothetical protein